MRMADRYERVSSKPRNSNQVVAVFQDSFLAFAMPNDATLEQVASRLAELGAGHGGSPLSVTIRPAH
jgi:hypothetical protein